MQFHPVFRVKKLIKPNAPRLDVVSTTPSYQSSMNYRNKKFNRSFEMAYYNPYLEEACYTYFNYVY